MNVEKIIQEMKDKGEVSRKVITVRPNGSKRVSTFNLEPSLTDQQWKEDADPNNIIEKYKRTGQLTYVSQIQGKFADVSDVQSLHEGLITVQKAKDDFMNLSSEIRKRFNNSVIEMVQFLNDPKNKKEAIELGLVKREIIKKEVPNADSNQETVSTMEASKEISSTDSNDNRSSQGT
jgi:hypothetical protein